MAFLWLVDGGDPIYLLTGMILQRLKGSRFHHPKKVQDFVVPGCSNHLESVYQKLLLVPPAFGEVILYLEDHSMTWIRG